MPPLNLTVKFKFRSTNNCSNSYNLKASGDYLCTFLDDTKMEEPAYAQYTPYKRHPASNVERLIKVEMKNMTSEFLQKDTQ